MKGLEPQIQEIIARHKEEIRMLRAKHEADLLRADERAANKYVKNTEESRDQYEVEKVHK